jgi:uncharacterized protein YndB with AHSA1/START domain
MSDLLSIRAHLDAPPSRVYRALTDPAELTAWLAEHADVDIPAGRYAFWGRDVPQGEPGRQRLRDASPERRFAFAWTLDGVDTTVTVTLAPEDGTLLTLTQDRMPSLDELMAPTGRRDGRHSMHTYWALSLANLADHLDGRPQTPRADFGPDRSEVIRVEVDVDAAPEEVFASLTDSALVERWWGWPATVEPHLGGRVDLGLEGEVFEFEPGKALVYGDGEGTVVRWELDGSQGRTHLTFVQSGYGPDELDSAAQHEAGWLGGIAALRRMHALGDDWRPVTTELPEDSPSID